MKQFRPSRFAWFDVSKVCLLDGYLRVSLKIVPSFMITTKFFS